MFFNFIALHSGVVSTLSRASGFIQWLVFGAGCSFPPPRDSIRNAALIPVPVASCLCQGGFSGPSSPDGTSAAAVMISPRDHVHAEQQQKRFAVFLRAALRRSRNCGGGRRLIRATAASEEDECVSRGSSRVHDEEISSCQ
ncbi:hypothetical protein G5714_014364 [Onychostoma macrolepis]|uniref:Uncharacterized protein n=1 Tax=Onychostoma macrolepis TaxID=369639 RepID=A0A7J6CEI7_9TELE|nr:hypothetical protein G5714_014364 [Onychostoma macrolepis]